MKPGLPRVVAYATASIGAVALAFGGLVFTAAGDLDRIKAQIRKEFPSVRQLSTDELKKRLDRRLDQRDRPLLLDVREAEEVAVSRLPGALRVDPSATAADAFAQLPELAASARDREIVVYCSVGYRSSQFAEVLAAEGFSRVSNLEGSIFEWAEKGYLLVQGQEEQKVYKVHPYSRAWAWLVPEPLRAYLPEEARGEASTGPDGTMPPSK